MADASKVGRGSGSAVLDQRGRGASKGCGRGKGKGGSILDGLGTDSCSGDAEEPNHSSISSEELSAASAAVKELPFSTNPASSCSASSTVVPVTAPPLDTPLLPSQSPIRSNVGQTSGNTLVSGLNSACVATSLAVDCSNVPSHHSSSQSSVDAPLLSLPSVGREPLGTQQLDLLESMAPAIGRNSSSPTHLNSADTPPSPSGATDHLRSAFASSSEAHDDRSSGTAAV